MTAPHEIAVISVGQARTYYPTPAETSLLENFVLTGAPSGPVSLVLANGQTVHVRRSDGWRTHHGRSRPAGLNPFDMVEVRFLAPGDPRGCPGHARDWVWGLSTGNPARITHWRRART